MTRIPRPRRIILVLLAAVGAIGCASEPLDFADWTLPVPERTRIIEYAHVPADERTARIEAREDLVIERGQEPFYRPIDVDVDAAGNIYVFDAGNRNIVVFGEGGNYLRTIGREGQGPGEISGGGRIAVVGSNVVHAGNGRLNAWTPDGELLSSRNIAFTRLLFPVAGTDSGDFLGAYRQRDDDNERRYYHVVRVSLEGEAEAEYTRLDYSESLLLRRLNSSVNTRIPMPVATFTASGDGDVYAVAGDEYQVLAFAPDGQLRWALRTSMRRPPLTDERIDAALEQLANREERPLVPPPRRSEVDWPATLPALVGTAFVHGGTEPIRVDGHGHLYVYPFIPDSWDRPDQPVDVYSRDGERLFSGLMPIMRWDAARDDFAYAVDTDPVTEEYRVVRYRLVEPFD